MAGRGRKKIYWKIFKTTTVRFKQSTFDFSDQEFVHEIEFLSENTYYIASLNCKLKLKVYIHEGKTIEKLSEKSRLLLDKGAV